MEYRGPSLISSQIASALVLTITLGPQNIEWFVKVLSINRNTISPYLSRFSRHSACVKIEVEGELNRYGLNPEWVVALANNVCIVHEIDRCHQEMVDVYNNTWQSVSEDPDLINRVLKYIDISDQHLMFGQLLELADIHRDDLSSLCGCLQAHELVQIVSHENPDFRLIRKMYWSFDHAREFTDKNQSLFSCRTVSVSLKEE